MFLLSPGANSYLTGRSRPQSEPPKSANKEGNCELIEHPDSVKQDENRALREPSNRAKSGGHRARSEPPKSASEGGRFDVRSCCFF